MDRAETVHASMTQRPLVETYPLVQRGLGVAAAKGGALMSAETLLVILVVGLIAGWLAGQVVKGTGFGLVADIAIGIVGALIGSCPATLGHPPRLRHCPCHHRRDYRRHHSAAHPQTGLQAREVVTA
jgi:hypothetical protein